MTKRILTTILGIALGAFFMLGIVEAGRDARTDSPIQLAQATTPTPATGGAVTVPPFEGSGAAASSPATEGSGSAIPPATVTTTTTTTVAPHDAVPNPVTSPVAAWDEAKAARKGGWAILVFFVLVALTKALAYGRDKLKGMPGIGWIARRLAVGKTAMIVAGVGAVAAAGYDVIAQGGSVTSALFAAGVALAGALHSTTKGA